MSDPLPEAAEAVLRFWFGDLYDGAPVSDAHIQRWFMASDALDREIAERFGADIERAASGALDDWAKTPHGRLAVIVLLDQFTRNTRRGTGAAFAEDPKAQTLCLDGLALGHDRALSPYERGFFYMPLEHAEHRGLQAESVARFTQLLDDAPEDVRPMFARFLEAAVQHKAIIDRFGRYPHRNARLGRATTSEEAAFLQEPGSSFG